MKKQIKIATIVIFSCFLITPVSTLANPVDPGWYLLIGGGASKPTTSSKNSNLDFSMCPVFNLSGGYKINKYFRADINAQYRLIKITNDDTHKTNKTRNFTAIVNGYLDWTNYSPLTPYLTAGVGISALNTKNKTTTEKNNNSITSALNIGTGVQFQMNYAYGIDLGYRYIRLGKLKSGINKSLGAHEILLNLLILL